MRNQPVLTEIAATFSGLVVLAVLVLGAVMAVFVLPFLLPLGGPETQPAAALADPNGTFVTVAGEQLYVTHTAPAAGGNGAAVILIHGFGGSTVTWRDTAPALAAAGYDVYAVDLLGFGLSEKGWNHDYRRAAQVARVIGIMDALGIERATVVGHSMGGAVAAQIALLEPQRVDHLVLVNASILADQTNSGPFSLPSALFDSAVGRRWGQIVLRQYVPSMFEGLLFDAAYRDAMISAELVTGYRRTLHTAGWDLGLLGILRDSDVAAAPLPVGDLTIPTLLVWGTQDSWVPVRQGETLRDMIPGAEYVAFADVGHLPMHEVPQDFNAALIAFLGAK